MVAIFALVNAVMAGLLFSSFLWWWNDSGFDTVPTSFMVFCYTLVGSIVWLLVTRAVLYWQGRKL